MRAESELAVQLHREAVARRRRMAQAALTPRAPTTVSIRGPDNVMRHIPFAEFERRRKADAERREAARRAREAAIGDALAAIPPESLPRRPSVAQIIREVAQKNAMSVEAMLSRGRAQTGVYARQEAMYRLRKETTLSLSQIARALGGFDHTTVLHGVAAHEARLTGEDPRRIAENRARMREYYRENMRKARAAKAAKAAGRDE